MVKVMAAKNKDLLKRVFAGRIEALSDDVDLYTFPGDVEIVVKSFVWTGEFEGAFQEIVGGICTTQLVNTGKSEHFCRMYDVFIAKDTLFMMFEKLEGDIETFADEDREESLEDPAVMWDLLFQLSTAIRQMQHFCHELVHFDVRHDNVQIAWLDTPQQLYPDFPYETTFVVKLIDFGQCELQVGGGRPVNEDVCHEEEHFEKWGSFPYDFCPGYDMQYFLYTLVDILESFYDQYYVLDLLLKFVDEGIDTEANKTCQSRPKVISKKTGTDVRKYLKTLHSMVV